MKKYLFIVVSLIILFAPLTSFAILVNCNEQGQCYPVDKNQIEQDDLVLGLFNWGRLWTLIKWGIVVAIIGVIVFYNVLFVSQQTAYVVELMGKFSRILNAGFNLKIPFFERIAGEMNLRVRQLDVKVETKTKDNVFVNLVVSIQYEVISEKIFEAFYKLQDPERQIESYVFDTVRASVPEIELDAVFEKKDSIALKIRGTLTESMDDFGYRIVQALVTDIDPDQKVKASMNEINASKRMKEAMMEKAEGEKILQVKKAEAEAQSKKLQGEGMANQRVAIAKGLAESRELLGGDKADQMVLLTQFFDTLRAIGESGNTKVIMLPGSPSGVKEFGDQIRDAMIMGNEATK